MARTGDEAHCLIFSASKRADFLITRRRPIASDAAIA
jgi:hypothetical protein